MSYPNALFSTFAFVGFMMCLVTFPWQLEAWNSGTCVFMIWAGLGCLNLFINSIVWSHNAINWSPIWCDISTKFSIGLNVAVPAAGLCIARRLYHISSLQSVTVTQDVKRRHVLVDLLIGIGLPVLEMILHYIVQGHRFDIFEDVGCVPSTYFTPVALVIVTLPPLIIGLISAVYATLNIVQFRRLRSRINEFPGYSNLTTTRFLHFMCLSSAEIMFTVPLAAYNLYVAISIMNPWISWADTHYDFSRVELVLAYFWRQDPNTVRVIEFNRWVVVFCAFVFFAFFGLTAQSRKNYSLLFRVVFRRVNLFSLRMAQRANLTPLAFQSAGKRRDDTDITPSTQHTRNDCLGELSYAEKGPTSTYEGTDSHNSHIQ
uniref:Pheromone receptor n=1 Tax=Psilocybe cubensis TaxID=181762 RepID=A0A8H7Y6F0_PSICU